jgi:hypothetical protein
MFGCELSGVVFLVGDELAPFGLGLFAWGFPYGQVGYGVVGGSAVPVPLARGCVDGVAGLHRHYVAAAGLDEPDAFGGDASALAAGR